MRRVREEEDLAKEIVETHSPAKAVTPGVDSNEDMNAVEVQEDALGAFAKQ
jgi:hypothetical protein